MYHPNSNNHWTYFTKLCDSKGSHNDLCKINSNSCSTEMSPYDICLWHYYRMATHHDFICACGSEKKYCSGDATARGFFREYYNCWEIPVQDLTKNIWCCGQCQNRDAETHYCGELLVGECCLAKHPGAIKLEKVDNTANSDNSDEDY